MTTKQTKTQGPGSTVATGIAGDRLAINHNRRPVPGASQTGPAERRSWRLVGVRAAVFSCGLWAVNCGEPQSTSAAVQIALPDVDTGHVGRPDTRQGGATSLLGTPAGDYLADAWSSSRCRKPRIDDRDDAQDHLRGHRQLHDHWLDERHGRSLVGRFGFSHRPIVRSDGGHAVPGRSCGGF